MYGPQGWWPLISCGLTPGSNQYNEYTDCYHPGDYSYPQNDSQLFEICVGAILTQNTAWKNVEKALFNLNKLNIINPEALLNVNSHKLSSAIKPAGYYNQKTLYLKELAQFHISLNSSIPSRKKLLSVKGIGPETADSILLYAYKQPEFVIDTYTKRIFSNLGFFADKTGYEEMKKFFHKQLPENLIIYQEYHALIVAHAKKYYSGKLKSDSCPLAEIQTIS